MLTLDCRGMRCPLPVIQLARHLGDVAVGEDLEVWATDPAARPDIAAWCRMRGQQLLPESTGDDGVPAYRVRRLV